MNFFLWKDQASTELFRGLGMISSSPGFEHGLFSDANNLPSLSADPVVGGLNKGKPFSIMERRTNVKDRQPNAINHDGELKDY